MFCLTREPSSACFRRQPFSIAFNRRMSIVFFNIILLTIESKGGISKQTRKVDVDAGFYIELWPNFGKILLKSMILYLGSIINYQIAYIYGFFPAIVIKGISPHK